MRQKHGQRFEWEAFMTRIFAALGGLVFALGAFVVSGAQEPRQMPDGTWQEGMYIPHVPKVGEHVEFESGGRCTVREVRREWVRCTNGTQWRNLYNGHRYSVLDAQQ
jgi:hypothetical protein